MVHWNLGGSHVAADVQLCSEQKVVAFKTKPNWFGTKQQEEQLFCVVYCRSR